MTFIVILIVGSLVFAVPAGLVVAGLSLGTSRLFAIADAHFLSRGKLPPLWKLRQWTRRPLWGYRRVPVLVALSTLSLPVLFLVSFFGPMASAPRIYRGTVNQSIRHIAEMLSMPAMLQKEAPSPSIQSIVKGEARYPLPQLHVMYRSEQHTIADVIHSLPGPELLTEAQADKLGDLLRNFGDSSDELRAAAFIGLRDLYFQHRGAQTQPQNSVSEEISDHMFCYQEVGAERFCRLTLATPLRRLHRVTLSDRSISQELVRPAVTFVGSPKSIQVGLFANLPAKGRVGEKARHSEAGDLEISGRLIEVKLGGVSTPDIDLSTEIKDIETQWLPDNIASANPLKLVLKWPSELPSSLCSLQISSSAPCDLDRITASRGTVRCQHEDTDEWVCPVIMTPRQQALELGNWISDEIEVGKASDAPTSYVFSHEAEKLLLTLFWRASQGGEWPTLAESDEMDDLLQGVLVDYATIMGNTENSSDITTLLGDNVPDSWDAVGIAEALGRQPQLIDFYTARDFHAAKIYDQLVSDLKALGMPVNVQRTESE